MATAKVKKAQCKVKIYQHDLNDLYRNISGMNMINVLILSLCKNKNIQTNSKVNRPCFVI